MIPFAVLAALLLTANAVLLRYVRHLRKTGDRARRLVPALAGSWLAVAAFPAHNFASRTNLQGVSEVAIQPIVELAIFAGAGLVALATVRSIEPTLATARPPLLLLVLPVWIMASGAWSGTGTYAVARGAQMAVIGLLGYATLAVGRADPTAVEEILSRLFRWLVALVALLAVLGVLFGGVYAPIGPSNIGRFTWVGAHPNGSALLLAAAAVVTAVAPRRLLRWRSVVRALLLIGFLVALYANHSRTSWLCLILAAGTAAAVKMRERPLVLWCGLPLLGFAAVLVGSVWGDQVSAYVLRDQGVDRLTTANGRLGLWKLGIEALETPFDWMAGLGYGAARTLFVAEEAWARTAHSSVLAVLVSTGLVGVALLLAMVGTTVARVVASRSVTTRPYGLTAACLLVLVLVNGLVSDVVAEPNMGFAVLCLVLAVTSTPDDLASGVLGRGGPHAETEPLPDRVDRRSRPMPASATR